MYLIGTLNFILKILRTVVGPTLLICCALSAHALERLLTPEEISKLEKNIAAEPGNVLSRRFLMDHYFKVPDWKKVVDLGTHAQKELPAPSLLQLTRAYINNGDGTAATGAIALYHSKFETTADSKLLEAEAILVSARRETQEEPRKTKAQAAIEVLRGATQLAPKEKRIYDLWVAALKEFWISAAEDSIQVFKNYESATGDYEAYLPEKCAQFVIAALWDQALIACGRSVTKTPENDESHINLAEAQKVKVSTEEAQATLQKLLVTNPKSARGHRVLAQIYLDESNFASSAEHFRKSLEQEPNNADSYLGLAKAEYQQKKYEDALEAYKQNCRISRFIASEFKNAAGQLRDNIVLHNKYKNVISSCRQ